MVDGRLQTLRMMFQFMLRFLTELFDKIIVWELSHIQLQLWLDEFKNFLIEKASLYFFTVVFLSEVTGDEVIHFFRLHVVHSVVGKLLL